MQQPILHTQQLSIGYHDRKTEIVIAQNINLSLHEASLIALVGANGIGKSTLLRTLTGIQKPLSGSVMLQQKALGSYNHATLARQLGVVLTEKLPPSNLTVFELVALGKQPYTNWIGKLTDADHAKINEALALTQTSGFAHRKYHEISDGQLQKALIARALAQDTPLIILDEPTTHLDLMHKVSLLQLLKQLARQTRKCIFFSTHDIDLALQVCDEMIVMNGENVVQDTPANHISNRIFDTLFDNEALYFDAEKGKFIFRNL